VRERVSEQENERETERGGRERECVYLRERERKRERERNELERKGTREKEQLLLNRDTLLLGAERTGSKATEGRVVEAKFRHGLC
jgi:hypothetical protein